MLWGFIWIPKAGNAIKLLAKIYKKDVGVVYKKENGGAICSIALILGRSLNTTQGLEKYFV